MTDEEKQKPVFEPRLAIGVFLAVFGLAVMGAALIKMPMADRLINVIAGLVILAAGAGSFYLGIRKSRSARPPE